MLTESNSPMTIGVLRATVSEAPRRSKRCNGLMFENLARGQLQARPVGTCHDLNRLDRVATKFEKVVFHSDLIKFEDIAPDGCQYPLAGCARRYELADLGTSFRSWQRAAVDLAGRSQRHRIERHDRRWHHVVREALLQRTAKPLPKLMRQLCCSGIICARGQRSTPRIR